MVDRCDYYRKMLIIGQLHCLVEGELRKTISTGTLTGTGTAKVSNAGFFSAKREAFPDDSIT